MKQTHTQKKQTYTSNMETQRLTYARLAERASGSPYWLPLAIAFALALLIVPVVWVTLAHWAGVPLSSGTGVSDSLAVIGGIMGAIFTVGGLVVGLVSVLTQLSIESRIRKGFKQLLPELDERARTQIEAHIAFTRATDEQDWQRAIELANDALEQWPSLYGVRSLMGERISNLAMEWFVRHEIEHERLVTAPPFRPGVGPESAAIDSITGLSFTANPSPAMFMSREQVPFYQALDWLKAAINHGEDMDSSLHARLALVHGMAGHFSEMKQTLLETLQLNGSLREYFLESWNMAMLAYACRNATSLESGLRDIGHILNRQLPATTTELLESLRAVDMSPLTSNWSVYWIAAERLSSGGSVAEKTPHLVILHIVLGGTADERTGSIRWRQVGGRETGTVTIDGRETLGNVELAEHLAANFVLISQYQPGWAIWRIYH